MAELVVRPQRRAKEEAVAYLAGRLREAAATVLVDYRGLRVAEEGELRRRLRAAGVEYRVVKNTLVTLAARQAGVEGVAPMLQGPTAAAFSLADATDAARVIAEFAREHPAVRLKGGVVGGRAVDAASVRALADLPPRQVLLSQVAGAFAAPLATLAAVLAAPLRGLVVATGALARARGAAAPTARAEG